MAERSARAYAEALLSIRSYSTRCLTDKLLEKGFDEADILAAIERLSELGYLNDESYARHLADSLTRRGYGARRIKQTLRHKGVDAELAEDALCDEDDDSVDNRVDHWLEKLGKGRPLDRKEQARLSAALFRRGFDGEDIRRGLRRHALRQAGDYDEIEDGEDTP